MKIFETFLYSNVDNSYYEWSNDLKNHCEKLSHTEIGVGISNAGGWQSGEFNWDNLNYFDGLLFEKLQNSIAKCFTQFNMRNNVNATFKNFWINVNPPGSYNYAHIHPGAQLSGIFYVKVPLNSGAIVFDNNLAQLNPLSQFMDDQGSDYHEVNPVEGQTLIFNSYVQHSVNINKSNENRISIAFNILLSK